MKNEYVSSAISMLAVVCGAMALVTIGAWLVFGVRSPIELLFSGVVGGIPIALLAPLFDKFEHPLDRFLLIMAVSALSTVAFAAAEVVISWVS